MATSRRVAACIALSALGAATGTHAQTSMLRTVVASAGAMQTGSLVAEDVVGEPIAGYSASGVMEAWHGFLGPMPAAVVGVLAPFEGTARLDVPCPNPSTTRCTIAWRVPSGTAASVVIVDVRGRCVRRFDAALRSQVDWHLDDHNGAGVGSGLYVVRLEMPDRTLTRRIVVRS